jgi:hypothetical protein
MQARKRLLRSGRGSARARRRARDDPLLASAPAHPGFNDARLSLAERRKLDGTCRECDVCRALDADASLDEALAALPEPPIERIDLDAAVRAVRASMAPARAQREARAARSPAEMVGWAQRRPAWRRSRVGVILGHGAPSGGGRSEVVEVCSARVPSDVPSSARFPQQEGRRAGRQRANLRTQPSRTQTQQVAQLTEQPEPMPRRTSNRSRRRAPRPRALRCAGLRAGARLARGARRKSQTCSPSAWLPWRPLKDIAADGWNASVLTERVLACRSRSGWTRRALAR